jgi:putative membrane protein
MYYGFFGMHWLWWIFWMACIVLFVSMVARSPRTTSSIYRESPLEVLQRSYAEGRISTEEYRERRDVLVQDTVPEARRSRRWTAGRRPSTPASPTTPAEH